MHDKKIEQLNSLLRGEISAVETFRIAKDKMSVMGPLEEIDQCLRSHEERVQSLQTRISSLGGTPADSSGAWGAFAKLVEGGAAMLGEAAAIAALEEGEDHGVRDYRDALDKNKVLDDDTRAFLGELMQKQLRTHSVISRLKKLGKGQPATV